MKLFIDGGWRPAASGAAFDVRDPATGEYVDTASDANAADADAAIRSAAVAFETWHETPVTERARVLRAAAQLLCTRADDFARTLTRELGRPLAGSKQEMLRTADLFDFQAEEGKRITARMPRTGQRGEKVLITREPVGVVVAITPFNYPVALLAFKLGSALMAGCTLVAKPSRHAFANSGQFCYRVARVYVDKGVHDAFLARLTEEISRLTVGNGLTDDCSLGPLVNEKIFANAMDHIADARAKRARIVTAGERLNGPRYDRGYFLAPTLVAGADHSMDVMTRETFGPVLGLMPISGAREGIALANATPYGLAGFVFSGSLATGLAVAERLDAGSVWVNDIQRSHNNAPFGGMKMSGVGREKDREGIEAYLETKTIYLSYDEALT